MTSEVIVAVLGSSLAAALLTSTATVIIACTKMRANSRSQKALEFAKFVTRIALADFRDERQGRVGPWEERLPMSSYVHFHYRLYQQLESGEFSISNYQKLYDELEATVRIASIGQQRMSGAHRIARSPDVDAGEQMSAVGPVPTAVVPSKQPRANRLTTRRGLSKR